MEEKFIELYKKRIPLKEIVKQTGMSRSSIYGKLKEMGLTSGQHHNTRQLKDGYDKITDDLSYIIGVMLGDGYTWNQGIGLEVTDFDFAEEFVRRAESQFGIKAKVYDNAREPFKDWRNGKTYPRNPTKVVRIGSILLRDFIEKIKPEFSDRLTKEQKIHFLRGLWDSEGNINNSGYNSKVQFTHKTEDMCKLFKNLLEETTGIQSVITFNSQPRYIVQFYGKDKCEIFYRIINPTIKRKREIFEKIVNW